MIRKKQENYGPYVIDLTGPQGNAFVLLGYAKQFARQLKFDSELKDKIIDEMTQSDLATEVGVTRQTIVAIEKAKYYPTLELAFLIARVFDKKVSDVFDIKFNE